MGRNALSGSGVSGLRSGARSGSGLRGLSGRGGQRNAAAGGLKNFSLTAPENDPVDVTTVTPGGVGVNEVQRVRYPSTTSGGTAVWTFGANSTPGLAHDASAATVQAALRALASVGGANVTVAKNGAGDYTVTFMGALAETNVSQLAVDGSGLTEAR